MSVATGQARCSITGQPRWRVVEVGPAGRVFFVYARTPTRAIDVYRTGAPDRWRACSMIAVSADVEPWLPKLHEGVYHPETRAG